MLCANCTAEVPEGSAFCSACGAPAPTPEPTPAEAAAARYTAEQARYEQELAAYQRQQAAYEQQQSGAPAPQSAQAPRKKSKAGLVVAVIALLLLLIAGCGLGGIFIYRSVITTSGTVELLPDSSSPADGASEAIPGGFATPEEALTARLAEDGVPDWVYDVLDEAEGSVTYIAGPPSSEYVAQYLVEQAADGSWTVTDVADLGYGEMGEGTGASGQGDAEAVVWEFLIAVYEDRGLVAQSFTVDPFSSDSASAQISAGGLTEYNVIGSNAKSDGSYEVQTTQVWYGTSENWQYLVVPTDGGYRIAECQTW